MRWQIWFYFVKLMSFWENNGNIFEETIFVFSIFVLFYWLIYFVCFFFGGGGRGGGLLFFWGGGVFPRKKLSDCFLLPWYWQRGEKCVIFIPFIAPSKWLGSMSLYSQPSTNHSSNTAVLPIVKVREHLILITNLNFYPAKHLPIYYLT